MNRTTKDWFTFHYRNPSRRNPEPLQQQSEAQPTKGFGGSRMAISDHKRSQPPQRRLGSKDPRVTSSQSSTSTNPRGEHKPMHKAMARAQVLKSFTLKSHQKQLMLMGGEERKNKEENHTRTPRSRSTRFPSLRGEMAWWKCRSRSPLTFPQRYARIMGGIERWASFSKGQQWRR